MPTLQANTVPNLIDLNHILPPISIEPKPEGRMATEEELEMFREADEEFARGEYYSKFPGETWEQFFDRIESDPEKWLECNLSK